MRVVDSHTGGEPTRVIVEGGPDLGRGSMAERLARFREEFDHVRSAVVNEPRGSDAMVGALLCEPVDRRAAAGVIFFNNVGYLGMCGHGTIGLMATLHYLGRASEGEHIIETPVGDVTCEVHDANHVTVRNVASFRRTAGVTVEVPGYGTVRGDVAWGGNWFYLVEHSPIAIEMRNLEALTDFTWAVRQALAAKEVDHIEVFGPSTVADSRNFVLCPGKAYDRSPCGTGTSAKVACLAADGKLAEGAVWRQESIVGSVFEASYVREDGAVHPRIRGSAYVNADARLIFHDSDPFRHGI